MTTLSPQEVPTDGDDEHRSAGGGARLAFGCNIGVFFSGVASTSLHGWLWIVCALAGTWIGVRLRPLFGLAN